MDCRTGEGRWEEVSAEEAQVNARSTLRHEEAERGRQKRQAVRLALELQVAKELVGEGLLDESDLQYYTQSKNAASELPITAPAQQVAK
jgi:hypothetical protein